MTSYTPFGGLILFVITVIFTFLSSAMGQILSRKDKVGVWISSIILLILTVIFGSLYVNTFEKFGAVFMVWTSSLAAYFITVLKTED